MLQKQCVNAIRNLSYDEMFVKGDLDHSYGACFPWFGEVEFT